MKRILFISVIALVLSQIKKTQDVTAFLCYMLGMSVNVGSQETYISIYHSDQYMTSADSKNIFLI